MLSPRRLRRLAAWVLLVWLFGLASGIANACIVSAQLRQADAAAVAAGHDHSAMADGALADMDTHHGAAGHDHGGNTPPPACERLCAAPAAAPQADQTASQVLGAFWLAPAPPPAMAVRPVPQSVAQPRDELRWAATIPISIAFLRLAL